MIGTHAEIMDALRAHIERAVGVAPVIGALPPEGGLALVLSGGTAEHYITGDDLLKLNIAISSKARDQMDALVLLDQACTCVKTGFAEKTDVWQVTGASVKRAPTLLGQDSTGWWMYGCNVEIRVYYSGNVEIRVYRREAI